MRTSISSLGAEVSSILTLLLKYNNMSKIRDNYLAEIIVLIVIATMLLTSCGSTKKCCIKKLKKHFITKI